MIVIQKDEEVERYRQKFAGSQAERAELESAAAALSVSSKSGMFCRMSSVSSSILL